MGSKALGTLKQQRREVRRQIRVLLPDLAQAIVHQLPNEADLTETLRARYDELAALDLAIASYAPQAGLFDDYAGGPQL